MDGETVGLGTIFIVYQTIRNARLPGGRLQEFYSISKLSIAKHAHLLNKQTTSQKEAG
jgi:hypothetical protein